MIEKLKKWAKHLKHYLYALYLAYHHKDVPLLSKIIAIIVVSYALSPIDLIPDFIPVLGYLFTLIVLAIVKTLFIKDGFNYAITFLDISFVVLSRKMI